MQVKMQTFLVLGLIGCAVCSAAVVYVAVSGTRIAQPAERTSVVGVPSSGVYSPIALLDVGEALVMSKSPTGDIPDVSVSEVISTSKFRMTKSLGFGDYNLFRKRGTTDSARKSAPANEGHNLNLRAAASDKLISKLGPSIEVLCLDRSARLTEQGLRPLANLRHLRTLYICRNGFTDKALVEVKHISSLKNLYLSVNRFTDNGIRNLKDLPNLEFVDLSNTAVTGSGLRDTFGEKALEGLVASDLFLKDDDLREISKIKIKRLSLSNNPLITDRGVEFLCEMTDLERLDLTGCAKLSISSRNKISRCLPQCRLGPIFDDM